MSSFENFSYSEDFIIEDGVLKEYTGNSVNIIIPEGVTEICARCFAGLRIKSIVIPESVNKMGREAFMGCYRLHSVYINDLSKWCNIDFEDPEANPFCNSPVVFFKGEPVLGLDIPDGVTVIKKFAFYNCQKLCIATLPESVMTVEEKAFCYCNFSRMVDLKRLRNIGERAFYGCSGLTDVSLWYNTELGNEAFVECKDIYYCSIDKSVNTKGTFAFADYWSEQGLCSACGGKLIKLPFIKK